LEEFLQPTEVINWDDPLIRGVAKEVTSGASSLREEAKRLFVFVRESIRYDPYSPFHLPEHYKATNVLSRGRGYCVQKAVLLVALSRARGIPSRLVFADIRNHLASRRLVEMMGTDLFVYHGYGELLLEGRWTKLTPAFEEELCRKHSYPLVEFNGREDALFPPYDERGRRFVEYIRHHGSFADLPLEAILKAWEEAYGKEKVERWKLSFK